MDGEHRNEALFRHHHSTRNKLSADQKSPIPITVGTLGLKTKGRVAPGMDADLVLFDPATVKPCPSEWVNDLPGGKPRLIERAEGIAYTLVGGDILFAHNQYQGGLPGRVVKA